MGLLEGKHALVTGGAKGIGRAIIKEFLKEGADIFLLDKDEEAIQQTLSEIQPFPKKAEGYHVDISRTAAIARFFNRFYRNGGREIDILVNNAGVDQDFDPCHFDDTTWESVIRTNLNGARNATRPVLSQMAEKKRGSIIFITSVHTAMAFPGGAAYDASKHALVGFMRSIALEYGRYGIRSNAIAPGAIYPAGRTGIEIKKMEWKIPLKRAGTTKEIAQVAVFLASEMSSYINGAEIRVDGGMAIQNPLFV